MNFQDSIQSLPLSTKGPLRCSLTGNVLLNSPYYNKGSSFTERERTEFLLDGLLPANVQPLEEQVKRAYQQYQSFDENLARNTFLTSIKGQNEVLFYKLVQTHVKEMFPVVYTPTEGEAIENYSRIFRKPEGCFLRIDQPEKIDHNLAQWGTAKDIDYIVVTDGEEILGIGDQGVGGVLISAAKLLLATLCAGVHPNRTLPVVLDVGTENKKLLDDDLYLGLKTSRATGKKYDEFVDRFIQSVKKQFPRAYIHFEDFGLNNARRLLDLYRPSIACFNDDVQGTGCVTLAAIYAGIYINKVKMEDIRILIFGSGSAGTGIADQIRDAIATDCNKDSETAAKQIWCVDKVGLLLQSQGEKLMPAQKGFAREDQEWNRKNHQDLISVIKDVKPHVLIGTSTCPGAFNKQIIQEMASHVERPMIFPLSNPTRLHEAVPEDLINWTGGKAIIATGSPFDPVKYEGKTFEIAECNNSVCFPGIGLGSILCRARLLSDKMLVSAVKALGAESPALKDPSKGLLPDVEDVREVSIKIAMAVIKKAGEEGLAQEVQIPQEDEQLELWVKAQMWEPRYRDLVRVGSN